MPDKVAVPLTVGLEMRQIDPPAVSCPPKRERAVLRLLAHALNHHRSMVKCFAIISAGLALL
jgi:hypothetical protein